MMIVVLGGIQNNNNSNLQLYVGIELLCIIYTKTIIIQGGR